MLLVDHLHTGIPNFSFNLTKVVCNASRKEVLWVFLHIWSYLYIMFVNTYNYICVWLKMCPDIFSLVFLFERRYGMQGTRIFWSDGCARKWNKGTKIPISPNTSKGSPHFFKRCWMCPEHEGKEIRFFFPIIKPKNTNHLQDSMLREVEEGK